MRSYLLFILFVGFLVNSVTVTHAQRPILIVTTDIGQDPSDEQSMIRLLHYADEFRIAGLVVTADRVYKQKVQPELYDDVLHRLIDRYALVEGNLRSQSPHFPSATALHQVVKKGSNQGARGIPPERFIGQGHDTEGSDWIIETIDAHKKDPIYISIWGGAADVAQALWKMKANRKVKKFDKVLSRLTVFMVDEQDASNAWLIKEFPNLKIILAKDEQGDPFASTHRGMFVSGDESTTQGAFIRQFILAENALTEYYPLDARSGQKDRNSNYPIKEEDTPAWFYFLDNGLNYPQHPAWGGWGGRYVKGTSKEYTDAQALYRDAPDKVATNGQTSTSAVASVHRWRKDFQHDFVMRIRWAAEGGEINHAPTALIAGKKRKTGQPYTRKVKAGKFIELDASQSFDPDGDKLLYDWIIYPEAGSYPTASSEMLEGQGSQIRFYAPVDAKGKSIHLILRVKDQRAQPVAGYARIILQIK